MVTGFVVRQFQSQSGLSPDGDFGPLTTREAQNRLWSVRASNNFMMSEFACEIHTSGTPHDDNCNGFPDVMNLTFVSLLQRLRDNVGAIHVTSGVRCSTFNASLDGSSSYSNHKIGRAIDCYVSGMSPRDLEQYAHEVGLGTIRYDNFVHVQYEGGGH